MPPGTQHGTVQRLRGEGPPKLGGRGRGDIRYRLVVDVPRSLSREQAEVVDELPTVMDGNPRSRLLSREGGLGGGRTSPTQVRGVYMISVAAELAGMHPQTLRIYEARGLITPKRSPKNTRLYSQEDVRRLKRIQELTGELGMNLAGVEQVFELETELERMQRRVRNLERHAERMELELRAEIERVRRSFKRELVLYEPPPEPGARGEGPVVAQRTVRGRSTGRASGDRVTRRATRALPSCVGRRGANWARSGHNRGSRVYKPAMARQATADGRGAARRRSQALRGRRGGRPRGPRHRARRVLHDARAVGLRQDHLPADDRRLRAPRRGRGGARRAAT